ncbi:MAG: hypothetical protein M1830_000695 [Pleopsidium flavum]|nr:MAG: hypothetical protein M1830_000695 [Pleopsidium flavum]
MLAHAEQQSCASKEKGAELLVRTGPYAYRRETSQLLPCDTSRYQVETWIMRDAEVGFMLDEVEICTQIAQHGSADVVLLLTQRSGTTAEDIAIPEDVRESMYSGSGLRKMQSWMQTRWSFWVLGDYDAVFLGYPPEPVRYSLEVVCVKVWFEKA